MSPERSQAYRRVMKTLDDMGPSKLFDSEQQRIRYAADNLVFSTDLNTDVEACDALEDVAASVPRTGRERSLGAEHRDAPRRRRLRVRSRGSAGAAGRLALIHAAGLCRAIRAATGSGASRCTAWPAPGITTTSAVGSARAISLAIALNFPSRSPTTSVDRHSTPRRDGPTATAARRCRARGARARAPPADCAAGRRATAAATAGGCPASTGVCAQRSANSSMLMLLDLVGEPLVGGAACRALGRVRDSRARSDQHQPLDARRSAGASAAWSAIRPPIEYPTSVNRAGASRGHVVEHRLERDRLARPSRGAVPADVGRERPVAFRRAPRPRGPSSLRCG